MSKQTVHPDTPVGRHIKVQARVNRELITKLHCKKDVNGRWRHGQVIKDNIEMLPRCGGMVLGKPKLNFEVENSKTYQEQELLPLCEQQKIKPGTAGLLLEGVGDIVPMDVDKAEVLTPFLTSVFTNKPRPLCLETRVK